MTINLELPQGLRSAMEQAAAERGLPLAEYALQVLASHHAPAAEQTVFRTGAELVAYWDREGLLGSRSDIEDPVSYARELRERNQNRRRD